MIPLVLLHAFPVSRLMYEDVAAQLTGQVLVPDLPGFGGAPIPTEEPSLDVYADHVASEMRRAGMGSAVVAGTSMGGYTAMALCRRHPDLVAGLGLIDTRAAADAAAGAEGRRAMADAMEAGITTDPLVQNVLPKLVGETTVASRPEVANQVRGWVRGCDPRAAAWAQRAMAARPDSFETLRSFDGPSLVVVGEEDVLTPREDAQAMVDVLRDPAFVVVPEAGHLTPVESPADVVSALERLVVRAGG